MLLLFANEGAILRKIYQFVQQDQWTFLLTRNSVIITCSYWAKLMTSYKVTIAE
jgi:hypothetical protein